MRNTCIHRRSQLVRLGARWPLSIMLGLVLLSNSLLGQGFIWPLYTYPTHNTWAQAEFAAGFLRTNGLNGYNQLICIVNPNSGPGDRQDPAYVEGIRRLKTAGAIVIGYQATGYGNHSYTTIQASINRWQLYYGSLKLRICVFSAPNFGTCDARC